MSSTEGIPLRPALKNEESEDGNMSPRSGPKDHGHKGEDKHRDKLLSDVVGWLESEKAKRAAKKSKERAGDGDSAAATREGAGGGPSSSSARPRTSSMDSDASNISLDRLQKILEDNMSSFGLDSLPLASPTRRPSTLGRRRGSLRRAYSSDTEYHEGDVVVPSCDVVLDNSKTMSYSGGGVAESSDTTVTLSTSKRAEKERKHWLQFKSEIVRLAHTLRLKGWRKVALERGGEIEVERLSGALTNAVYVVSPPPGISQPQNIENGSKAHSSKPPPKLLLRIYGPQVEHLIDRENELEILKRLSRKRIGPRMLGTFRNGRFEEYFNATTLKFEDLRVKDTSKQIAKRMRELHEGIDLLEREREEGPFVWRNWDKWVDRCEEVITYLDSEILSQRKGKEAWRERGLICGVGWKVFKAAVDKYRKWLDEYYKKKGGVENRLVFAHNDTQYGNILRLIPPPAPTPTSDGSYPPPSPLLLPANHHKQLIVIDFEYASANTPGLEFANHFTEWCYNYHDPKRPWACETSRYPTLEQQRDFIRSYVNHRPQFNPRASATPKLLPLDGTTSAMRGGVNEFLLDSRAPGGSSNGSIKNGIDETGSSYPRPPSSIGSTSSLNLRSDDTSYYAEEERKREAEIERQVTALLEETRIWRLANSAQWVAWGIVQATVPELDNKDSDPGSPETVTDTNELVASPAPLADPSQKNSLVAEKRPEGLHAEALKNGESEERIESELEGGEEDETAEGGF
ncbi:putative Choline kinase [Glarea lozoyensis 74030]|uniref:Putative Choline kinase n=1 Tax=Glarea lozoyensis (strain ATCC 74030 / MF5533) TaxID=1104152 RepID=H0EKA2_GLAL7|nr:putative Choline kinase [Glarea lozoyensis 74030]